jgi:hypothetical protein
MFDFTTIMSVFTMYVHQLTCRLHWSRTIGIWPNSRSIYRRSGFMRAFERPATHPLIAKMSAASVHGLIVRRKKGQV